MRMVLNTLKGALHFGGKLVTQTRALAVVIINGFDQFPFGTR